MKAYQKRLILILLALIPIVSMAQLKYSSVNYAISVPMGDTKDYIEDASFRSFNFETGQFINDNLAIGLGASWIVFNQTISGDLLELGNTTLAGKQFRYINSFPIYINMSYYFSNQDATIKPYAGIGVGTMFKIQRTEIGVIAFQDTKWHFALMPHAGLLYALGPDAHINLDLKYHQAFGTSDSDAVSYLSIDLGLHYIFF